MWVSLATVFSNTMWWPPMSTLGGMLNMIGKTTRYYALYNNANILVYLDVKKT